MTRSGLHSQIICSRVDLILGAGQYRREGAVTTIHPSRIRWIMWIYIRSVLPNEELRIPDARWTVQDVFFNVVIMQVYRLLQCFITTEEYLKICSKATLRLLWSLHWNQDNLLICNRGVGMEEIDTFLTLPSLDNRLRNFIRIPDLWSAPN